MINIELFRAVCHVKGKTAQDIARDFGIDTETFNKKVRESRFKIDEVVKLSQILKLNIKQTSQIFAPELFEKEYGCPYEDEVLDSFTMPEKEGEPVPRPSVSISSSAVLDAVLPAASEPAPVVSAESAPQTVEDEGVAGDSVTVCDVEPSRVHYKTIWAENVLTSPAKDFLFVEDFMEMTGQSEESCRRLMRKIKEVSDVSGVSTAVHRVDYMKYLQYQLDRNAHRSPHRGIR